MVMRRNSLRRLGFALALLTLTLTGCAETEPAITTIAPSTMPSSATLSLSVSGTPGSQVAVDLQYEPKPDEPGPRMMELHIRLSDSLRYVRSQRLAAAAMANKELTVQPKEDGTLRLVLHATRNTTRLESGPLARLWFEATGAGTVTLLDQHPIFAPPEADKGIVLGPPLSIEGPR